MQIALDGLAKHEQIIARFYIKRSDYTAALSRLEGILRDYPDYTQKGELFYDLGVSLAGLGRAGEAKLYFERVITEFPDAEIAGEARKQLEKLPA
jgi:outer membrane protein assembly factor BamD